MLLEIPLAGYSSHWTFRGSRTFSTWVEEKPWLREGGLCVIRTENAEVGDLMIPSICRAVHGSNGGESRLDVRKVEVGGQAGTPVRAMLREFELDPGVSPFEARDKIRASLLDRSFLVVFVESDHVGPNDWEEIVSLLEYYRKATTPIRLSAVVIDGRGTVSSEPVCDFLNGRPTHHVLSDVSSMIEEGSLWPAYLHHRAAWEAGGSLSYAMSLASQLELGASCDDESVELVLQGHANRCLANHSGRQQLYDFVGLGARGVQHDQTRLRGLKAELFALNLLWRPPSMNSLHVVPWAARALLELREIPKTQVWALRHYLVCTPLAGEIMSLCLQFESQIQTKMHGRQDQSKVSPKTIANQDRFKSGSDNFVVYPRAFPALPTSQDDVWAFASLGENLKSCPSSAVPDLYWRTLSLRNAIAHGHYVGWHHVRMALGMLRYFDT